MRPPTGSSLLVGLLLGLCLGKAPSQPPAPEPAPPPQEEPQAPDVRPPFPPPAERAEAAAMVRDYRKNLQAARATPQVRLEVVQALIEKSHVSFVAPLAELGRKDPSKLVKAAAFKALGALNYPETRREIAKLLGEAALLEEPLALLGVLEAVERLGYEPAFFAPLESLFPKVFDKLEQPAAVQQKIIRLFGQGKEKRAFRLLLGNLEEPGPEDVDCPNNPPASYWEKRWKAWRSFKGDVREALRAITGVEFEKAALYKAWAKKEGAKQGIK